jgi:hypothetical protein
MAALWHLATVANPAHLAYAPMSMAFLPQAIFNMHGAAQKFVLPVPMEHHHHPAFIAPSPPLSNPELAVMSKLPESLPRHMVAPLGAPVDADHSVPIPLELIEDCRHREDRCANALRIPSLEVEFPSEPDVSAANATLLHTHSLSFCFVQ